MPRNGSGTAIPPVSVNPVAPGTVITSNWANTSVTDMYNELTNSLPRDGQAPMLAPLKIVDGSVTIPGLAFNSESASGLFRPSAGIVAVTVAGVEGLRVNSGARTLIGTTSDDSSSKLQVGGNALISGVLSTTGNTAVGGVLSVAGNATVGGTLTVTGTTTLNGGVSGTGITALFAAPPTIGSTTPNTGAFTSLQLGNSQYLSGKTSGGTSTRMIGINGSNTIYVGSVDTATGGPLIVQNGTEFARFDTSGNFGIGVAPATWVAGAAAFQSKATGISESPLGGEFTYNSYRSAASTWNGIAAGGAARYGQAGDHRWYIGTSASPNAAITWTQAMTLDASGNFNVGTTSAALTAAGRGLITVNGSSTAFYGMSVGSTSVGYLAGSAANIELFSNGFTAFTTAGTERMRVDTTGNLGIGMTPSAWRANAKAIQFGTFGGLNVQQNGTLSLTFAAYESGSNTFSYTTSGDAPARYRQVTGAHYWDSAVAGTSGGAVSFNQNMVLDANGILGLGTTPSAWGGAYKAVQNGQSSFMSRSGGSDLYLLSNAYYDGTNFRYVNSTQAGMYQQNSGIHSWSTATSGTSGAVATFGESMRIDTAGNLLIGSSSTAWNAAGRGVVEINGSSSAILGLKVGAVAAGYLFHTGTDLIVSNEKAGGALNLQTSSVVRAAIDSSGLFTYGGLEVGYRDVPRTTGGLTRGQCYSAGTGFTVNTGLAAGSCYSIFNNSTSAITITQGSGLTLRLAGTATSGNRTIAGKGMATIWVESTTEYIMSGAGVT